MPRFSPVSRNENRIKTAGFSPDLEKIYREHLDKIDAELVNNQRIGKSVMYELNPEMLQNMIDVLTAIQHPETADSADEAE